MERILKAFKDLFNCENPIKRHLLYVLLMVLPSVAGAFAGYIDKETPKEMMLILLAVALFFLILSIVPLVTLLGFGMEFFEMRLRGESGFPRLAQDQFSKGLKTLPLAIIWSIYYGFIVILFVGAPVAVAITTCMSLKDNVLAIVGIVLLTILVISILLIGLTLLTPFINYIFIRFVKDYKYKGEYLNLFTVIKYIKKSFKSTIMVFLKMFLAGIVLGMCASIIVALLTVLMLGLVFMVSVTTPETSGVDASYTPAMLLVMIPFSVLGGIIQTYVSNLISFAASDQYVEVYKNEIEPTENEFEI